MYRVSGHSPIIAALMRAADNGKQVTVLVELKARFDEENNIHWALKLEEAGCHVIYGLAGLKTHCKILLVVRREEDGLRRYVHLGTGNYNDSTARQYTDMGMFTCRESFGADASSLFNVLTGCIPGRPGTTVSSMAPDNSAALLRRRMIDQGRRPTCGAGAAQRHFRKGKFPWWIRTSSRGFVPARPRRGGADYAGGARICCCLAAGLPGVSETVTVYSVVGQLLEHSRIFRCTENGKPAAVSGQRRPGCSATWIGGLELVFPVEDEGHCPPGGGGVISLTTEDTVNARVQPRGRKLRAAGSAGDGPCLTARPSWHARARRALQQKEKNINEGLI
ncbi:MAG: hypothetical protein ACLU9S_09175 [Oscillospiraceae bacterium]